MARQLNLDASDLALSAVNFEPGVGMMGSCSFQSGKGVGIREELKFNKAVVPVLRKDLIGIKNIDLEICMVAGFLVWEPFFWCWPLGDSLCTLAVALHKLLL
eukprot:1143105-Pelagomonas_calceolata.AAC.1